MDTLAVKPPFHWELIVYVAWQPVAAAAGMAAAAASALAMSRAAPTAVTARPARSRGVRHRWLSLMGYLLLGAAAMRGWPYDGLAGQRDDDLRGPGRAGHGMGG